MRVVFGANQIFPIFGEIVSARIETFYPLGNYKLKNRFDFLCN